MNESGPDSPGWPEVIARLSELLREILDEPAARQRLAEIGFDAQWIAPKEFAARLAADSFGQR